MSRAKKWLENNEPFLRLAEVVAVTVIGSYIAWQQYRIAEHGVDVSERQLAVAEKELTVAEKELQTADFQSQVARTGIAPYFTFSDAIEDTHCSVVVKNTAGRCRHLSGRAVFYLETDPAIGIPQQLTLLNFFDPWYGTRPTDADKLAFRYPRFIAEPGYYKSLVMHSLWDVQGDQDYRPNHRTCWYIELSYISVSGETKIERYVIDALTMASKPVPAEPSYCLSIDMGALINKDGSPKETIPTAVKDAMEGVIKISKMADKFFVGPK